MPTDVLLSIEQKIAAEKKNAANLFAMLFLVPVIACLGSILLSLNSQAFAAVVLALGMN